MDEQVDRPETEVLPLSRPAPRRRRRWPVLLVLLIAVGIGVVVWRGTHQAPQTAPPAGAGTPAQPVGAATVDKGDIRVVLNELGTVTPLASVTVKTQISGQLLDVGFQEGQMVNKGDFLAQVDPRPYQVALEKDQGQLAHDQGLLDQAQADLKRYQTLGRQDSIAQQQVEDQRFLVQQYQGTVKVDQGAIDNDKLNIAYCHIIAPVSGRVGLRQVDPGNYVQTSDANGIVVLTLLDPISVIFTVTEDNLPQVMQRLASGATLPVDAYDRSNTTRLAIGQVATVDNQIDTTTGTVKIRATFANPKDALFPNQFVNARLLVDTLHDVTRVPGAAVQQGAPGAFVYIIGADGTVSVKPLKLGVTDGPLVQVLSGLSPGDRVVTDGTDRLRDGAKVTVPVAKATAPGATTGTTTRTTTGSAPGSPAATPAGTPSGIQAGTPAGSLAGTPAGPPVATPGGTAAGAGTEPATPTPTPASGVARHRGQQGQ